MSGVLHPVGPEPASTYWLRRSLVIVVLILVVVVIVALASRGSDPQSVPAVPASASPASDTPPPGDVSPVPSSAATSRTAEPTPRSTPSSKATPTPKTLRPKTRRTTAAPRPTTSSTPRPKSSSELCDPAALRLGLDGKQQLHAKTPVVLTLSLTNSSATGCSVSVNAENFQLTIFSGKDEIWSTSDCSTAVKSVERTVASKSATEWRMTWNGRRSVPGCKNGTETLKPGTYLARAQTEGLKATLRMTLVG
jgi:hypothetical protein